jgi:hypothetical protein
LFRPANSAEIIDRYPTAEIPDILVSDTRKAQSWCEINEMLRSFWLTEIIDRQPCCAMSLHFSFLVSAVWLSMIICHSVHLSLSLIIQITAPFCHCRSCFKSTWLGEKDAQYVKINSKIAAKCVHTCFPSVWSCSLGFPCRHDNSFLFWTLVVHFSLFPNQLYFILIPYSSCFALYSLVHFTPICFFFFYLLMFFCILI